MFDSDPELLADFVIESREGLADVEQDLLAIENSHEEQFQDLVNKVFRTVHSIKGAATFLELETIKKLSHSLESVLNLLRDKALQPSGELTDVLLAASDSLAQLFDDVTTSNDQDVSEHLAALEQVISGAGGVTTDAGDASEEAPPADEAVAETGDDLDAQIAKAFEAQQQSKTKSPEPTTTTQPPSPSNDDAAKSSNSRTTTTEANIRVSVSVLDHLMNLAGELVLSRNQLLQVLHGNDTSAKDAAGTRVDQVTTELQEAIMQTRLQPIGNAFSRFSRVVRDLSRKLGKEVDLVLEGTDVEVDKTILEAIGDPLTHLVRNSLDHGIEMPDVRTANGKAAKARLVLSASHQAGNVQILIQDDGGGIDTDRVKDIAVSRGLITAERAQQISDRDAVRLIFEPGFSTAEQVSDVSGRGVGMDVVRTNIEALGGTVDVESTRGVGTTITIAVPLTLAIVPSLIVLCDDQPFAIPQVNIVELVRVAPSEVAQRIGHINGDEVLRLRGELLPLVRLRGLLEADSQVEAHHEVNVVVLQSGAWHYGLVVDELHDSYEIVVKSLGRHLADCRWLAGATVLGDGQATLILDAAGIASDEHLSSAESEERANDDEASVSDDHETQTVVLFKNDEGEQFAVPMILISRIESVTAGQIDSVGGSRVLQFRGGTIPLVSLEESLGGAETTQKRLTQIAIFEIRGREAGLIIPGEVDLREVEMSVDDRVCRQPGVVGSLVIEGHTTRLIDLVEISQQAHPEWFDTHKPHETPATHTAAPQAPSASHRGLTALVAEDSTFFRRSVKSFLESEGLNVIEAEDGAEAWEILQGNSNIQLLLTDIEMPRMNGFELSQRVKQDETLSWLPIIALTSLAGREHEEKAIACGIDEYQVKMDKDAIRLAVRKLLGTHQAASNEQETSLVGATS